MSLNRNFNSLGERKFTRVAITRHGRVIARFYPACNVRDTHYMGYIDNELELKYREGLGLKYCWVDRQGMSRAV